MPNKMIENPFSISTTSTAATAATAAVRLYVSWPLLLKSLLTFGTRPHHWRAGTRRYVASPAAAVAAAEAGPEAAAAAAAAAAGAVALARDARRELGILVEGARRFEAARTARPQQQRERTKQASLRSAAGQCVLYCTPTVLGARVFIRAQRRRSGF